MRIPFLLFATIAFLSVSISVVVPPVSAQPSPCRGFFPQPEKLESLKESLAEMSTNDPQVINQRLKEATEVAQAWRAWARGNGVSDKNKGLQVISDLQEFWREKKAHLETGGIVEVQAGRLWASQMRSRIDAIENSIVGTWNWWNGYTVTFNSNGGASYRGSSLVRSGVGRWLHTGGGSYHIHWLSANTNDFVTLSSDGMKLDGKYDGKPGRSTRRC